MNKCGILIEIDKEKIAIPVNNFSKENVLNALSKIFNIGAEYIEQISACTSYGLYGIKRNLPLHKLFVFKVETIKSYRDDTYALIFQVDYIQIRNK